MTTPMRPASGVDTDATPELPTQLLGLLRSELLKVGSTAAWWALLIPAASLSLLLNLVTAQGGGLAFTPAAGMAFALGSFSSKLAVVYGVVCASAEFRHRTITTSYLTAPNRSMLLGAKAAVAALVGAGYAVVSAVAGLLGTLLAGGLSGAATGTLLGVCGAAVLTFALWAVLGVGVGTMLTSQVAAIVGVLLYLWPAERILAIIVSLSGTGQIEEYLPGGAADTVLTQIGGSAVGDSLLDIGTLPWWLALLIFAGYAVVAAGVGGALAQTRDVT